MNTDRDIKYIEKLLSAFFDGTTTAADEKELYRFFAQNDIPAHLQAYKPVFAYFDGGIREECRELPEETFAMVKPKSRRWWVWPGIAASLLLFVFIGIRLHAGQRDFNPYEGSYIVRNGVRIDDPEMVRPEVERTIERIKEKNKEIEIVFERISQTEQKQRELEARVQDPRENFLQTVEDEETRNKLRKILEGNDK